MKKAFISNESQKGYNITIVYNKKTKYYWVKVNKKTGEIIRIVKCEKPAISKNIRQMKWADVPEKVRRKSFRDLYTGPWDPLKYNIYMYNQNRK